MNILVLISMILVLLFIGFKFVVNRVVNIYNIYKYTDKWKYKELGLRLLFFEISIVVYFFVRFFIFVYILYLRWSFVGWIRFIFDVRDWFFLMVSWIWFDLFIIFFEDLLVIINYCFLL